MATQKQIDNFITKVGKMAKKDMAKSKILASITIAQACLESGYGESELARKANNLFGIKKHDWKGKTYAKDSYEVENGKKVLRRSVFRAYDSWQDSINDHSKYLATRSLDGKTKLYAAVVGETNYKKAAKALQKAGYSTYPNYAEMLVGLIEKYDLTRYDKLIRIFLDAGHGGKDSGACYKNRKESGDVLRMVKAVGAKLVKAGFDVKYDRTTDTYHSPANKADKANRSGADYFFSFHRNSFGGKTNGYETLFYSKSTKKDKLRKGFAAGMARCGFAIRADKQRRDLAVLRKTDMPALLLEIGFIDSDKDNKIFDEKFDQIAAEIAKNVINNCT